MIGEVAETVEADEGRADKFEDMLGTYLVKLSSHQISEHDSAESTKLLKIIGDFERISDHAVNIVESMEEMKEKKLVFSESAKRELDVMCEAIKEIVQLTNTAFINDDMHSAVLVEPLEQVIDNIKAKIKSVFLIIFLIFSSS